MIDRRRFIGSSLAGGVATAALPASLAAPAEDYKALVCVLLLGGLDAHDVLVPTDAQEHRAWRRARSSMLDRVPESLRARERLIPLKAAEPSFGFVPEMAGLAELYRRGELAVVANTGPLVEPVTRKQIADRTAVLPPRLGSHNDQQSVWQTMDPEGAVTGWGGRMLDALAMGTELGGISVNRPSSFVVGETVPGLTVGAAGPRMPYGTAGPVFRGSRLLPLILEDHFRGVGQRPDNLFERDILAAQRRAYDSSAELAGLLRRRRAGDDALIEGNPLSEQLAMVAKLISVRRKLELGRQVFCVQLGGFDTHRNQFESLPGRQRIVSEALLAFQETLDALGVSRMVTTFTMSEFGRTLVSNASGTDHGWGGHQFVIGGAVRGGRVIGELPPSQPGHERDWRRGALIPDISLHQFGGELARWFGLGPSEIARVFPGIDRFDRGVVELF